MASRTNNAAGEEAGVGDDQEGAIARRMEALRLDPGDERVATEVLGEILKFAKEKEVNAEVLVRLGAGRLAVEAMRALQHKNEEIALYGSGALAIIARNQDEELERDDRLEGREAAAEVVRALKLYGMRNDGVAINGTGAVLGLAVKNAENRAEFVRLGAPNVVVAVMKAWAWRNLEVAINGCAALWDFTENVPPEELKEMSVRECGEAMMEALKNFGEVNEDVAVFGTAVVENLLVFEDDEQHTAREKMRAEGIVELLGRMRRKHLSDTFVSTANSVLRILGERGARGGPGVLVRREEESGKTIAQKLGSFHDEAKGDTPITMTKVNNNIAREERQAPKSPELDEGEKPVM